MGSVSRGRLNSISPLQKPSNVSQNANYAEGVRRQDIIRNGSYISNTTARGKTNAKDNMVLFPIPNAVIVQGRGVVQQNPNY